MLVRHREYTGNIEFRWEDGLFRGHVLGMNTKLKFEGKSVDSAIQDFHRAINEYLSDCRQKGITPEVSYMQRKRIYIDNRLYRCIDEAAKAEGTTPNEMAESVLRDWFLV